MADFFQLTIDCADPDLLVAFWQPLIGYDVAPPPAPHATWRDWYLSVGVPPEEIAGDGADRLVPPEGGHGIPIWFQVVPERKSIKNRLHLDLRVSAGRSAPLAERRAAIETAVADVIARGGSLVRFDDDPAFDHVFALMHDPEGNEFCLV